MHFETMVQVVSSKKGNNVFYFVGCEGFVRRLSGNFSRPFKKNQVQKRKKTDFIKAEENNRLVVLSLWESKE